MSLSAETVAAGRKYKVIKEPPAFFNSSYHTVGQGLVGQVGICKWANYRGVCMRFPNGDGYIIPYDCIEEESAVRPRKIFRSHPTPSTAEINKEIYRISRLPDREIWSAGCLGKICSIIVIEDERDAVITVDGGATYNLLPLNCLEYIGD